MNEERWTSKDMMRLHETLGELRLRYGKWAYYELARLLPKTIEHIVIAAALEGQTPLADAEAGTLRKMMDEVLGPQPKAPNP